ncbi:MAG TPA: hypothetical protein QGH10_20125 [Armatimonadota bacterium]|nr:hypothetical protein [Armatimonadota bacterium]
MAKRMKATGDCYDDAGRIVPAAGLFVSTDRLVRACVARGTR